MAKGRIRQVGAPFQLLAIWNWLHKSLQGLKPFNLWGFYGTTKVAP
jgi:hypothetical protein